MVKFLSNLPIFRRLLIIFVIILIIPSTVILLLSNIYLTSLSTREQAVQTSFDAQSLASQEQVNLQRMNALLQTRFNQIIASISDRISDPSLANASGLVGADIAAREAEFDQTLTTYQTNYEIATSPDMSTIQSILINDSPQTGPGIVADQQQALHVVAAPKTGFWPRYLHLQQQEVDLLDSLDPTVPGHPSTLPQNILALKYSQAYAILWQANFVFTDLNNSWSHVVADSVAMGKAVTAIGPSETQPIVLATAFALGVTFLFIIFTAWLINLTITQPLRRLASLTRRIARGDTGARARILGRDEISIVATLMNHMLDNIVGLIQNAENQRDNLQAQLEKLVSEVSGVGEGDLRIQAEVTVDALGVLADSFNYMVEELGSLVVHVKMVAQEVERSTTMTFEHMRQLVETADMQIKQIATSAFEIEHMAQASQQVAEKAQSLDAIAGEARQTAEVGRASLQQTIEGMERIHDNVQDTSRKVQTLGERSREINNVVEVISTIAYQTNRLALDAAIQAAMAGENGKGFGAVAADIRRLAEKAKGEASEIARIVRIVREDIGSVAISMHDTERETLSGAKLAQEAGTSLESIFGVVERQAKEIEIINQMAKQQLQSSSTIVQTMQRVSDASRQSSQSTRVVAQKMELLARLAERLLVSVEAFKLREDLNYYVPNGMAITQEDEDMNQLTVSGVFRTVTATAQSARLPGSTNLSTGGKNGSSRLPS